MRASDYWCQAWFLSVCCPHANRWNVAGTERAKMILSLTTIYNSEWQDVEFCYLLLRQFRHDVIQVLCLWCSTRNFTVRQAVESEHQHTLLLKSSWQSKGKPMTARWEYFSRTVWWLLSFYLLSYCYDISWALVLNWKHNSSQHYIDCLCKIQIRQQ